LGHQRLGGEKLAAVGVMEDAMPIADRTRSMSVVQTQGDVGCSQWQVNA